MKAIISTLLLTLILLLKLSAQQPLPCTSISVQDLNSRSLKSPFLKPHINEKFAENAVEI